MTTHKQEANAFTFTVTVAKRSDIDYKDNTITEGDIASLLEFLHVVEVVSVKAEPVSTTLIPPLR